MFFYRIDTAGRRVRWKFLVDEQFTIISEVEAPEESDTPPGVTVEMVDGHKRITRVSPELQRILRFFLDSEPCWFEGCPELREQYHEELARLGRECPDCQKGALIRKYRALIEARLKLLAPAG